MSNFVYTPPAQSAICVVHKDDDLLVVSKPAGLLSVPGKGADLADCMLSRAAAAFPGALLTHRLDMDTSGLLLLAMNKRAQSFIGKHFENRLIHKTYIARVWGQVKGEAGLIDLPLCFDFENRPRHKVCYINGRPSQTRWKVIGRDELSTRVELEPLTGRSHQLRVHMKALGHPLMGDQLYAPEAAVKAAPRLCLHAYELKLHHPNGGKLVEFRDECSF